MNETSQAFSDTVIVVANSCVTMFLDGVLTPAQSVLAAVQGKPFFPHP
jgi:K+ transporter